MLMVVTQGMAALVGIKDSVDKDSVDIPQEVLLSPWRWRPGMTKL
jgi:hypothetical protein